MERGRSRTGSVSAFLMLVVGSLDVASAAVWFAGEGNPAAEQDPVVEKAQITSAEVARRFGSSVVLIQAELLNGQTQIGSGFCVAAGGVIATSLHVLDGARSVLIQSEGQKTEAVTVRAFDAERDLGVIQTEGLELNAIPRGEASILQRGDVLYVISNPLGLTGTVSEGILSAWREPGAEESREPDTTSLALQGAPSTALLQIGVAVSPGSSGAPVFDAFGRVVGVVAGSVRGGADLNFAVPIDDLVPLLDLDERLDLASFQERVDRQRGVLAEPHVADARFYLVQDQVDEAALAVGRALAVFPRSVEALMLNGQVLSRLGRLEEAGQAFRQATEANPDSGAAWLQLGQFLMAHGRSDNPQQVAQAGAAFEKALELEPWNADAAHGLGQIYAVQDRLPRAREMLQRAVDSDPSHGEALVALGLIQLRLGDVSAAKQAFADAIWVDPDNALAHFGLTIVYLGARDTKAGEHCNRFFDLIDENAELEAALGWAVVLLDSAGCRRPT